jgi:hypothetical protein
MDPEKKTIPESVKQKMMKRSFSFSIEKVPINNKNRA